MKSPSTLTNIRHLDEVNDPNITSLNDTTNISLSVPTTVLLTSNITNESNDTNNTETVNSINITTTIIETDKNTTEVISANLTTTTIETDTNGTDDNSTATPSRSIIDNNENWVSNYNSTQSSSGGLSTGGIIGIAIPCIAALVGVGAAAE